MSTSGVPARLASLLSATACVSEFGRYWCVCARATACHSRTGRVRADEDSPALASVRRARQWPKTVKSFEGIEAARNDFRLSHFLADGRALVSTPTLYDHHRRTARPRRQRHFEYGNTLHLGAAQRRVQPHGRTRTAAIAAPDGLANLAAERAL